MGREGLMLIVSDTKDYCNFYKRKGGTIQREVGVNAASRLSSVRRATKDLCEQDVILLREKVSSRE